MMSTINWARGPGFLINNSIKDNLLRDDLQLWDCYCLSQEMYSNNKQNKSTLSQIYHLKDYYNINSIFVDISMNSGVSWEILGIWEMNLVCFYELFQSQFFRIGSNNNSLSHPEQLTPVYKISLLRYFPIAVTDGAGILSREIQVSSLPFQRTSFLRRELKWSLKFTKKQSKEMCDNIFYDLLQQRNRGSNKDILLGQRVL